MRWLVEVAAIDTSAANGPEGHGSIVVEAESWQKALQAGRAARGEPGPISGFSIELLDDGYRAIDPTARKRYTVKRAPADAVAEVVAAPSAPPPGQSASAAPPPEAVPHAAPVPAQPPRPGPSAPGAPRKSAGGTLLAGSAHAVAMGADPSPPAAASADATIRTESLTDSSIEILSITDAPPIAPPPPPASHHAPPLPPAAQVADYDREPVPATQVIFKREHDPNDRIPLTYREYVYAVARGADEAAAERLLHHQLENVKRSIGRNKKGKFVNLAVFDVVFQGRPPVPPLATLAWKDWVGTPVVGFPRRPRAAVSAPVPAPAFASAPAPAPAFAPAFAAAAAPAPAASHSSAPPPGGYTAALEPVATPAVTPPPSAPPPSFPLPAPTSVHTPFAAPPTEAAPAPMAIPAAAPSFPQASSGIDPFAPGTAALPPGVPVPAASSNPYVARPPSISSSSHPPPMRALMNTPTPSRPSLRSLASRRASGDELIASLFEAMHELHFARDVIEGGDYVLSLAMEMIPSRAGLVHLYDIDRREYVIAAGVGAGTDTLLNRRHPETEALLSAAMRKRRSIVVADTAETEWSAVDRFLALGGAKTFIASPVNLHGRFLAVIELINPLDGVAFTEKEGNAIDYISDQFAEFVATKGMLLDPERIAKRTVPA